MVKRKGWNGERQRHSMAARGISQLKPKFIQWNIKIPDNILKIIEKSSSKIAREAGIGDMIRNNDGSLEAIDGYEHGLYYLPNEKLFVSVWHGDEGFDKDNDEDENSGKFTAMVTFKIEQVGDYDIGYESVYNSLHKTGYGGEMAEEEIIDMLNNNYNSDIIRVW